MSKFGVSIKQNLLDIGLLSLRLLAGGTMLFAHGLGKISNFSNAQEVFPDVIGLGQTYTLILAIGVEVGCSVLLMAGVFTRLIAIPLLVEMLVAFVIVHLDDSFAQSELSFLFGGMFLVLMLTGGGKYSAISGRRFPFD